MKKQLLTIITVIALVVTLVVPSFGANTSSPSKKLEGETTTGGGGAVWDPGGDTIPGAASLFLAKTDGTLAGPSQLENSGALSDGYFYILTRVYIDGANDEKHDGQEVIQVVGYNGSTLENVVSMEEKSGSNWTDVTDTLMNNGRDFTQRDHIEKVYRIKVNGDVQLSLQYKVVTEDTPAQYYASEMKFIQISNGNYYYTMYESNVSTAAPTEEPTEAPSEETSTDTTTEATSTTESASTTEATSTVAPTTTKATTTVAPTTTAQTTTEEVSTTVEPTAEPTTVAPIESTTVAPSSTATTKYQKAKAPGKVKIKKVWKKKRTAKKIKVKVKAVKGAKGYEFSVYKSKKNAKKHVKALVVKYTSKAKYTIKSKKLKNKKKLFVGVRAYNSSSDGIKVFGPWAKIKKVKVK